MIYEAQVTGRFNLKYWVRIPTKYGQQDVGPLAAVPGIDPLVGEYVYVGALPAADTFVVLSGSPIPTATITWENVTGKPSTFAPSAHNHAAAETTSGVFAAARLPAVTSGAQGAMLAADKVKLDAATVAATANTIAYRGASGEINVAVTSAAANAARKDYVDTAVATRAPLAHTHPWADVTGKPTTFAPSAHTHAWADITGAPSTYPPAAHSHDWASITSKPTTFAPSAHGHSGADITSGTIPDARIANATASLDGLMPKADKSKLDAATSSPTASTVAMRDVNGGLQVIMPAAGINYVANRAYVDAGDAGSIKQGGDNGSAHLDTVTTLGQTSTTASGNVIPANGYPLNGSAGELDVRPFHATRPAAYLIQEWTQWSPFRKWGRSTNNATAATPVWTAWVEITSQVATSLIAGLMSAADKAKLDTAAYDGGPNSLAWVNSSGYLKATAMFAAESAAQYNAGHALTRKDYVDDNFLGSPLISLGTLKDLNDYTTTGRFYQSANTGASGGSNYPAPFAGRFIVDAGSTFVWQEYTLYSAAGGDYSGTTYRRGKYNSTWSPWQELLTARADGLDTWARMTITDSTNFKPYAGVADNLPEYSKVGREVRFEGILECLTAGWITGTTARKVGTIPAAMAPTRRGHVVTIPSSGADRAVLDINTAGEVRIFRYGPGTNSAGAWLPISTGWRV